MLRVSRPALYRYGFAFLVTAIAIVIRVPLSPLVGTDVPFILFFPTVTLCAWYGGFGPGLLATILSALAATFLYIEPFHSLSLTNPRDLTPLVLFISGSTFMSWICGSLRGLVQTREETLAAERVARAEAEDRQQQITTILESITDGFALVDSEWRYTYLNPRAQEMIGQTLEEVSGRTVWEIFPDAKETLFYREAQRARAERVTVGYEEFLPSLGKWFAVRHYPSKDGGHAVYFQDITQRKEAEGTLQQTESRYRTLFETTQDGIMIVNEEGRYIEVNESLCRILKAPRERLIGAHFSEFIPPGILQKAETGFAELKTFSAFAGEFPLRAADGQLVELDWTSRANFLPGLHFCVAREITERKQQEATERFLAESSMALSSSLDYETTLATVARLSVPHFADWCTVDMANGGELLSRLAVAHVDPEKVVWARELYERYPPDPAEPIGIYQVLRTGKSEFYPDIPDELLAERARDEEQLEIMRQIGFRSVMIVPLKMRDRVLGVITFVNSDSGRHHTASDLALAEELAHRAALAVENARLYRLEQQTRQAAERTSDRLLRLQEVSTVLSQALTPPQVAAAVIAQGVNSLGASAGTIVVLDDEGINLEIVGAFGFPQEIVNQWQSFPLSQQVPLADAVRGKEPVLIEAFTEWLERYPGLGPLGLITGNNSLVAFPLTVEGRTIGAMGLSFPERRSFNEDDRAFMLALAQQCAQSLERARLYEREQRLRAEAEGANRLKDEFLATVSHELRTPLTAMLGWAHLLRAGQLNERNAVNAMETIERNARSQAQLIDDLLDVSRIITGKLLLDVRPTDPASFIGAAIDAVRPAAEAKGVRIQQVMDTGVSSIAGDPSRLQQVIWNLLSNAIKFTPRGGRVMLSLERVNSHIEIAVSDTGAGISEKFLPHVFDRFRQADQSTTREHGGLGLGLAIVRHLVELHGGTVHVESQGAGMGATFTVKLPLLTVYQRDNRSEQVHPAARDAYARLECPERLDGLKVLVVDDEADTRELLRVVLEQCGAEVATAETAEEALSLLESLQPDVLVSDIGMPDQDGFALISRVRALPRERGGRIPAVALTAYARVEDRLRALRAGFQMHVPKPVELTELVTVVVNLVERSGEI